MRSINQTTVLLIYLRPNQQVFFSILDWIKSKLIKVSDFISMIKMWFCPSKLLLDMVGELTGPKVSTKQIRWMLQVSILYYGFLSWAIGQPVYHLWPRESIGGKGGSTVWHKGTSENPALWLSIDILSKGPSFHERIGAK